MTAEPAEGLLCPSAKGEDGSILLGVVGSDGVVGYLQPLIRVDDTFLGVARRGRSPERRFRFAQPCAEAGCGYWTGAHCGVLDQVLDVQASGGLPAASGELPRCSIRRSCRWFHQRGPTACGACPYVVTEVGPDGTPTREARLPADQGIVASRQRDNATAASNLARGAQEARKR